uniref:Si:ch211-212k18.8 n=1 Tax=Cyprinus carpio carpio TaxID=630221 RepID=A0A8C0Y7R3_CYPCA
MTSEVEPENPEVWGVAAAQSASGSADADTLMEVTFQKNPSQKYKYLEAEPKILGVTEIALTVFFVVCRISFYMVRSELNGFMLAFSCVGIISGSVAIAAQKLHMPTLKACLGMQVVTCVAYTFCLLETFVEPYARITDCWHPYNHSNITHENDTCIQIEKGFHLLFALDQLTELTQIVLSITIAAYCCKVIPCCSPTSHVGAYFIALLQSETCQPTLKPYRHSGDHGDGEPLHTNCNFYKYRCHIITCNNHNVVVDARDEVSVEP